jgi:hypothetical protein
MFTIRILINDNDTPAGKLADVELRFTDGPLAGLKLIGFSVWERRDGQRNVKFPARQNIINGERRRVALLRPVVARRTHGKLRDTILAAYHRETEPRPSDHHVQ